MMWWLLVIPIAVFLRYQRTHERGWFPPTSRPVFDGNRPAMRGLSVGDGDAGDRPSEDDEGDTEEPIRFAVSRGQGRGQSFSSLDRVSQPSANIRTGSGGATGFQGTTRNIGGRTYIYDPSGQLTGIQNPGRPVVRSSGTKAGTYSGTPGIIRR